MFTNVFGAAPGIVAERFAFSSSIGFSTIVAWLIYRFFFSDQKENKVAIQLPSQLKFIGILVVLVFSVYVVKRNSDWKSTSTLYLADVKKAPNSAKLNSLMGTEISNLVLLSLRSNENKLPPSVFKQKADSAIMYFEKAIAVYPNYAAVHNNVGTIQMMAKENYFKARYHFKRAVEIDSAYTQALFNLGFEYQFDHEVFESLMNSFKALSADSNTATSPKVLSQSEVWNLGLALHKSQKAALGQLQLVLRSKSKEELENKLINLEPNLKMAVETNFASAPFVPLADSFAFNASHKIQDIILNSAGGDPETVIKSSFIKHVGTQLARHFFLFQVPKDYTSWFAYFELKEQVAKDSMILCYNQTLHFDPAFMQAYNQLNNFYIQKQMNDSVIALNMRMMKFPQYRSEQLEVYIANAYVLKGDTKSAIEHYENSSDININLLSRLALIQQQMVRVGNNYAAMLFANWYGQKQKEIKSIYQILSAKYLELGDVQKGTEFQTRASSM
jgi:hypothetical protein